MILQSLVALYDRLDSDPNYQIPPLGYAPQKIGFKLILNPDGSLFDIQEVNNLEQKQKYLNIDCPEHKVRSGSKILPQFICDNAKYILGFSDKLTDIEKADKCRLGYLEYHTGISIDDSDFRALQDFLTTWSPGFLHQAGQFTTISKKLDKLKEDSTDRQDLEQQLLGISELFHTKSQDLSQWQNWFSILAKQKSFFGIFEIQGKMPLHENLQIKQKWNSLCEDEQSELPTAQCLITGETKPVIDATHPKIKGFESATALVGIQRNSSYESYELEQGLTSPISATQAFKYATALSWMLNGQGKSKHRLSIAATTCAYWTSAQTTTEDIFADFLKQGSNAENVENDAIDSVRQTKFEAFFKAVKSGSASDFDVAEQDADFFILGIEQPNPGRFSIRFFYHSTVKELINTLHKHQSDIRIIKEYDNQPDLPAKTQLINETAQVTSTGKKLYDTIPPLINGALMRSILEGTPYPAGLYSSILRRVKADRNMNYLRASIIKGVLNRNHNQQINYMLDKTIAKPPYLLGRLFAVLEQSQRQAHDFKNDLKTIRESFFSSASSTPSSVFPRLQKLHIHHLRKLKPGSQKFFEDLIGEILSKIGSQQNGTIEYPKSLRLEEQGVFMIGYYHQITDLKSTKKDKQEDTESN